MNYEEMLSSSSVQLAQGTMMPLGFLHKKKKDGKIENVLDLRKNLAGNVAFCEDVKRECEENTNNKSPYQIHFVMGEKVEGECRNILVQKGRFTSFSQLLFDTPSLAGRNNFMDEVVQQVFEAAIILNKKGIYHICYSPDNVLARVGDNKVMLLSHGSYYLNLCDQMSLYGDMQDYVAPEVFKGETVDARTDVYSIGKFLEWLFSTGELSLELKRLVKKATSDSPAERFQNVEEMRAALKKMKTVRGSITTFIIALIAALCIVGFYFGITPEQKEMEYVKPAPKQATDDLLDDGFDPVTELGVISGDSLDKLPPEIKKKYEEYEKKGEDIFRKRFEKEADRILSKIYNAEYMGASEKNFMASSKKVFSELAEIQAKLAGESNLTTEKSQIIATQIIEKVTEEKKKKLTKNGIQKGDGE